MLALNAAQVQALQAIRRERQLALLARTLADGLPEISGRLGERFPRLIELGVQRGTAHGLRHVLCLARYLACWCALGAEFENKPGFAWAALLLKNPGHSQGAKVFQLCKRTREELVRLAQTVPQPAGLMPVAGFDAALAGLDANLLDAGYLGELLPGAPLQLGQACDIDAVDIRRVASEADHGYGVAGGQWTRLRGTSSLDAVKLVFAPALEQGTSPGAASDLPEEPALPPRLAVLSHSASGRPARLRLRTLAASCCDPMVHPMVAFHGLEGLSEWRGPNAGDVTFEVYADTPYAPASGALQPPLAMAGAARVGMLTLSSCGMRDAGAPLGEQRTYVDVHPAEQHLLQWRREPGVGMDWPTLHTGTTATAARARCRLERDGVALEPSRWQAGLEDLDRRLSLGLDRLFRDWERTSGVSAPRMHAEPAVMSGDAGLTWGWALGPQGMQAAAYFRIAGLMELVVCQLNLQLGGEWELQGAKCRLSLQCHGRELLQSAWERGTTDTGLLPILPPTSTSFSHPFVMRVEVLATPGATMLDCGPVTGAVVGSGGLRPRADGMGLQWFAKISIEPVHVKVHWHDPLLGIADFTRPLLPALDLLDWTLG